jgi:hypothetical protein
MTQYPLGTIKENLYTVGNKFILNDKPYIGYYHQITNKYYTETTHTDNSKEIFLIADYVKQQALNKVSFDSTKSFFVKKVNESTLKKVDVNEYNKVKNDPLYNTFETTNNPIIPINNPIEF